MLCEICVPIIIIIIVIDKLLIMRSADPLISVHQDTCVFQQARVWWCFHTRCFLLVGIPTGPAGCELFGKELKNKQGKWLRPPASPTDRCPGRRAATLKSTICTVIWSWAPFWPSFTPKSLKDQREGRFKSSWRPDRSSGREERIKSRVKVSEDFRWHYDFGSYILQMCLSFSPSI